MSSYRVPPVRSSTICITASGPLPTVFVRTPYNELAYNARTTRSALSWVSKGYAFVIQNERGRYFSGGDYQILGYPQTDGYDALTWIAAQPWSNGKVGTLGCSASAEGQLALAAQNHPAHAAMVPQAPADSVLPGYWEYTTSALGVRDTETKCVRPSEINRFFGGLSTNKWRCTYPTRVVGNLTGDGDQSRLKRQWANAIPGYSDGHWGPAPVRSYPAEAFGTFDLVGNVSEWVLDCWHDSYRRAPRDGSAWVNPGCSDRVIRGASWASSLDRARSAYRQSTPADTTNARVGFRVVREL